MDVWKYLIPPLKQIYIAYGVSDRFKEDEKYLGKAFKHIKQLWEAQFQSIEKINFVLLGEAPFYGETKSYFYNEHSQYTPFFRHEVNPIVKSTSLNKSDLFLHLKENGFIILDIFPFALNKDTAIDYKKNIKDKKALDLFNTIYEFYFVPKLKKIKTKATKKTVFCLRYKKNKILSDAIKTCLESLNFVTEVECIASNNMPINSTALQNQYSEAIKKL